MTWARSSKDCPGFTSTLLDVMARVNSWPLKHKKSTVGG
jgi:hypothetical protein